MKQETIERLRTTTNIADIIGEVVSLKKLGSNYAGQCPFHKDESDSLSVSVSKQIFHCFACKVGGDVFKFLERYYRFNSGKAVKFLIEGARSTGTGNSAKKRKLTYLPRAHQRGAIDKAISNFRAHDRGTLVLPPGTGRILVTARIREQMKAMKTLVLVPSLSRLYAFWASWSAQRAMGPTHLAIFTEEDIITAEDDRESPGRIGSGSMTSDPRSIRDFLRAQARIVIYCTYQSSPLIAVALKNSRIKFDLAVCDGAHKLTGEKKSSRIGTILNDKSIPVRKRLFITRTLGVGKDSSSRRAGGTGSGIISAINDKKTYGPLFIGMSLGEAITQGIVPPHFQKDSQE